MDVQHTKHVTYKLGYHFVWCPTYREKILVGKIATFIEQEIRRICADHAWTTGVVNIQPDHLHLFLSRNVTMRTLLVRQDWIRTGILSMCPDASDKEAKAARLARYAELRWSPDASLRSQSGGH